MPPALGRARVRDSNSVSARAARRCASRRAPPPGHGHWRSLPERPRLQGFTPRNESVARRESGRLTASPMLSWVSTSDGQSILASALRRERRGSSSGSRMAAPRGRTRRTSNRSRRATSRSAEAARPTRRSPSCPHRAGSRANQMTHQTRRSGGCQRRAVSHMTGGGRPEGRRTGPAERDPRSTHEAAGPGAGCLTVPCEVPYGVAAQPTRRSMVCSFRTEPCVARPSRATRRSLVRPAMRRPAEEGRKRGGYTSGRIAIAHRGGLPRQHPHRLGCAPVLAYGFASETAPRRRAAGAPLRTLTRAPAPRRALARHPA
jgi:hypothetical protein